MLNWFLIEDKIFSQLNQSINHIDFINFIKGFNT